MWLALSVRVNQLYEYFELCAAPLQCLRRPPKIATIDAEEIGPLALPFVSPVFVLSTGRCGTKWLTELLCKEWAVFG
jgi:hypothetical protein